DHHSDWWFASTGIPLLAAALGPLANVSSITALVTFWREQIYIDGQFVSELDGILFADPQWCYWLNVCSLICGFIGNLFLLFNFTQRIRYIIALPATIFFWFVAFGILAGITASMQIYAPPTRPEQTYTQGFWYAIAAAVLYLLCSMILMINMLGHFRGHYPDSFVLSGSQRTLIQQTMVFIIWLAGGAAVFSKIETQAGETGWQFADAMYFCDVTILTVGFGDLYPTTNLGRGMVFPYSIGGTITLGLIVSSIYKSMRELGQVNIVQKHTERMRERTAERVVTNSFDFRQREQKKHDSGRGLTSNTSSRPIISAPTNPRALHPTITTALRTVARGPIKAMPKTLQERVSNSPHILLLREEKDRFKAMREIQHRSRKFRKWMALLVAITAFGILWCIGAIVFWQTEKHTQDMTYFKALYFCYVALLTIGYGDLAPKSNAGRTFFVIWSLIAVPTMTILIGDMSDTVIVKFRKYSDKLADFTVLPKQGIWKDFLEKNPWLVTWLAGRQAKSAMKKRLRDGFEVTDPDSASVVKADTDTLGRFPTHTSLSRRLALSIKRVAADLHASTPKRYEYEEWVEFTRLIRYAHTKDAGEILEEEEEEGMVKWDWIGANSPLMSEKGEPEWLLNRLCESLVRL
ncbi:voltage-gated potassium channel, partial [Byssothecium circinans]